MTSTRKADDLFTLRIRWMSREAWNWARAQAVSEGKSLGNLLSELMQEYRDDVSRSKGALPQAPYRDYSQGMIGIRDIDQILWNWVKDHARSENKTAVRILCELIGRHERRVSDMRFREPDPPSPGLAAPMESTIAGHIQYKSDYQVIRTIYRINRSLWGLVKARAKLENQDLGELFSEVIDAYRESVGESDSRLEMTSPYGVTTDAGHSIRGVDENLWRWVRGRSMLEGV